MDRRCAFGAFVDWIRANADPDAALGSLSLAFHGWPDLSRLSVGRTSIGNGFSCHFCGSIRIDSAFPADKGFLADRSLVALVAFVPPDVLVGNG